MKKLNKTLLLIPAFAMLASCGAKSVDLETAKERAEDIISHRNEISFGMPITYTMSATSVTKIGDDTLTETYSFIKDNNENKYLHIYTTSQTNKETKKYLESWFYQEGDKLIHAKDDSGNKTYTEEEFSYSVFDFNVVTAQLLYVEVFEATAAGYVLEAATMKNMPVGAKMSFTSEYESNLGVDPLEYTEGEKGTKDYSETKVSALIDNYVAISMDSEFKQGEDYSKVKYHLDAYKAEIKKPNLKDFVKSEK